MKRAVASVCTPADPTLLYVTLSSVTVAGRSKPPHPVLSDTANPGTHGGAKQVVRGAGRQTREGEASFALEVNGRGRR